MNTQIALLFIPLLVLSQSSVAQTKVSEEIKQQILKSKDHVDNIIDYMLNGNGKHQTFNRLAELGDTFGSRQTGSQALEDAIDYILKEFKAEKFDNPHGEELQVPKWVRGNEWAELVHPRRQKLPILSLGTSIGTGDTNIEANVVVVKSLDELKALNDDKVKGNIVVFNSPWQGYNTVIRSTGALRAAEKGAVAALIRSVTQFSIASPHTGNTQRATIPAACITVEDAEMLQRMYDRGILIVPSHKNLLAEEGWNVTISLYMEADNKQDATSRNVVAEITGSEFPNSTVIFGGHIDSWDVGDGSMDDGGGVMIAWQALSAIKALGIKPRRTIRLVLWTAEEQGLIGAVKYFNDHKQENESISLVMESDNGAFKPRGIGFTGVTSATSIMEEILTTMLSDLNMTSVLKDAGSQPDTQEWVRIGVPGVSLYSDNEKYFYFHHTHGDSMTVLNADDLDRGAILWATVALTVANLEANLPRTNPLSSQSSAISSFSKLQVVVFSITSTWFTISTWKRTAL